MPGILINKIFYGNEPDGVQSWRFQYKLPEAPESAYVTFQTTNVNTAGVLSTPATVPGLPPSTAYFVRATNLSCSPGETYTQQYITEAS